MSSQENSEDVTHYFLESVVPTFLANDGGYISVLKSHLRNMMLAQGWEIFSDPRRVWKSADEVLVDPPVGFVEVRVEISVREFDTIVDMDES